SRPRARSASRARIFPLATSRSSFARARSAGMSPTTCGSFMFLRRFSSSRFSSFWVCSGALSVVWVRSRKATRSRYPRAKGSSAASRSVSVVVPMVRTWVPSCTVTVPSSETEPNAVAAASCSGSYSVTGGATGSSAALGFFAASAAGVGAPGRGPDAAGRGFGTGGASAVAGRDGASAASGPAGAGGSAGVGWPAGAGGSAGAVSALSAEGAAPTSAVGLVSSVVGCSAIGSDGGVAGENAGQGGTWVPGPLTVGRLRRARRQGGTLPPGSGVGQVGGAPSGAHRLRELYSDTRVRDDASRRRAPHRTVGDNGGGTQPRTEKEVHRMAKIAALSGFPEWLPAERLVEQHVIDVFREVAELHGFSGIETRAVEPLD